MVAACVFEVIEKLRTPALRRGAWLCLGAGMLLQMLDWEINKEYLYALEIDKLAKKQADIEVRKNQLMRKGKNKSKNNNLNNTAEVFIMWRKLLSKNIIPYTITMLVLLADFAIVFMVTMEPDFTMDAFGSAFFLQFH